MSRRYDNTVRVATLAIVVTAASVMLDSMELALGGALLAVATVAACAYDVRPHNHWRGFRRHRH